MRKPTVIYEPYSIVVVPFPFTEQPIQKRRPALVISSIQHQRVSKHITLLMITTSKHTPWPSDHLIKHLPKAGLTVASLVRQKIFTLDSRLIMRCIGKLAQTDEQAVKDKIGTHLAMGRIH